MTVSLNDSYLDGRLLVAMPDMMDPRFSKSVILMIFHTAEGAMGVVVNKPAGQVQVSEILRSEGQAPDSESIPVYFGGPVDHERAIIVHSRDCEEYASTKFINEHFGVTTTPDILEDFSKGEGPSSSLLVLGYAGWAAGQLESELEHNSWLTCDGNPELVFEIDADMKWEAAIKSLGISPSMLSSLGGSA